VGAVLRAVGQPAYRQPCGRRPHSIHRNGTGLQPLPRRVEIHPRQPGSLAMLHYAVVFFVIALIAAVFGFGGIAASAAGIAKILFFLFAVLAIGSFLVSLIRK
jgi:uncharacterized membrane protein YtjA (UPF0391 family)